MDILLDLQLHVRNRCKFDISIIYTKNTSGLDVPFPNKNTNYQYQENTKNKLQAHHL